MKKRILLPFIALLMIPFLTSCDDMFEKEGNILDYVGSYVLDGASETTYHIYWNQKTLISQKDLNIDIKTLTINLDKTVTYTTKDGVEKKGKVKVLEKYCRFYSLPVSSSYKFNHRYDGKLYYSYESKHASVEYDVTYRSIVFAKTS